LEAGHRVDLGCDRLERAPLVLARVLLAQLARALERHAPRHVAGEDIVRRGLVGDDVDRRAAMEQLREHERGVADERDRQRALVLGCVRRELEGLVDRLHADPQLVLVDDERRRDEQHVPAAEDVDVALEQRSIGLGPRLLPQPLVPQHRPELLGHVRRVRLDQRDDRLGGEPRQFTGGDWSDSSPCWSPDGRTLAFISDRKKPQSQIYVICAVCGVARALTSLTTEGAVVLSNFSIPALKTRQAKSTVELPSGGSLAIAGLISDSTRQNIDGFPGLKDVPMLEGFLPTPVLIDVRFEKWNRVLAAPQPPAAQPGSTTLWHWARGAALAARGDVAGARAARDFLSTLSVNLIYREFPMAHQISLRERQDVARQGVELDVLRVVEVELIAHERLDVRRALLGRCEIRGDLAARMRVVMPGIGILELGLQARIEPLEGEPGRGEFGFAAQGGNSARR